MQDNLHIELKKKKKEKYQSNFKIVDSAIEVKRKVLDALLF